MEQDAKREANWKRWGPYLSERQWGTVREDYSPDGSCWTYFPHDHARSRAYRWGEDGLLGLCDRECRLCFGIALWNERDPILKERFFGLTGPQGNHGEDVKELYYYLDSSPTHSYCRALYKYPQAAYPYQRLIDENAARTRNDREFELTDTGVFDERRYFDVGVEYAKRLPDDLLIRISITNHGPDRAPLHILPSIWFRNTWTWGCVTEEIGPKPWLRRASEHSIETSHPTLGKFHFTVEPCAGIEPELLFTENETNHRRVFNSDGPGKYFKDAFHERVIAGNEAAVNPSSSGTKAAAWYRLSVGAGETIVLRARLTSNDIAQPDPFGDKFDLTFAARKADTNDFYDANLPRDLDAEGKFIARQAYSGLLWNKQFYNYVVKDWLEGDPNLPAPPAVRKTGRNHDWMHLFNRDLISMPDKWEYPWYAAWDHAFHMVVMARLDPEFAKDQLILLLREWYMHPNGQLPAYEFNFSDVNPPVHAWAVWRVYKMTAPRGQRDRSFLARCFQKLLINFTWWVNRKDVKGNNIFGGGFLGLDNIGIFDRSQPLPGGGSLEQADGTAWMAFYCGTMLSIALELASEDPTYEDVASKFFEHFIAIVDAINTMGGTGLWDETDGFYYDQLQTDGQTTRLRTRSLVGLIPLLACEVLEKSSIDKLPGFQKRMQWFIDNRKDLSRFIIFMSDEPSSNGMKARPSSDSAIDQRSTEYDDQEKVEGLFLLAIPSKKKLKRVLRYALDEKEFLSPFGLRSLSRFHLEHPFRLQSDGGSLEVHYTPGESDSGLFGGNSNWRGPIWFPINFLFVEALQRYHHYFGDSVKVECPTGSGRMMNLDEVSRELAGRLGTLFRADETGARPSNGQERCYADDPAFSDLVLFYEHFHGDTGRGLGASHQTGWTSLVARCLEISQGRQPSGKRISTDL